MTWFTTHKKKVLKDSLIDALAVFLALFLMFCIPVLYNHSTICNAFLFSSLIALVAFCSGLFYFSKYYEDECKK
jgi:hypothetical protein